MGATGRRGAAGVSGERQVPFFFPYCRGGGPRPGRAGRRGVGVPVLRAVLRPALRRPHHPSAGTRTGHGSGGSPMSGSTTATGWGPQRAEAVAAELDDAPAEEITGWALDTFGD